MFPRLPEVAPLFFFESEPAANSHLIYLRTPYLRYNVQSETPDVGLNTNESPHPASAGRYPNINITLPTSGLWISSGVTPNS